MALCPLLLSLGADDKKERRDRLGDETFTAILLGSIAAGPSLVVVNAPQGRGPF